MTVSKHTEMQDAWNRYQDEWVWPAVSGTAREDMCWWVLLILFNLILNPKLLFLVSIFVSSPDSKFI